MKSVQTKVIIYGAGRGGHLVAEMLSFDATKQVIGMVDDNSALWGKRVAGIEVLGGKARLLDLWHERYFDAVVISLATPSTMGLREELYVGLKKNGVVFTNAIHPAAVISPSAQIGENNVISPGTIIGTLTRLGDNNRISGLCNLEHHSTIGSHNFFGAHCVTGGAVTIGDRCVFGMGSVIDSLLSIGDGVRVGNGVVVRKNLPNSNGGGS